MFNTLSKPRITGAIAFGDSLSDEGKKYNEDICGCFPFKWFLYHSDYNNFTNGHTWAYIFANIFNETLKEKTNWLAGERPTYFKNVAEGGATTYNYRNLKSFFKYFKGFILSFFLGNTQNQAKKVKKNKNILNPNKLGIIFAGANDLVTLGYDDLAGVERAVQGIIKTIETLINRSNNTEFNYLKNLLLIGLPDISETPRFKDKSSEEKSKMKLACQLYNQKLQELSNEYQYVNFDCCTVYQYANINDLDQKTIKKIEKGIILVGEGTNRTVRFINNGKFITNKSNEELKEVTIKLNKEQQEIFSTDGEIIRGEINGNKLDIFVNRVAKNAKLNMDLKMIGIEAILDEILQNPETHGFTSGCAVYYLPKIEDQETDISLISKSITIGNAVIIKEDKDSGFFTYLIKDGVLVAEQEKAVKVEFGLSVINQIRLRKKIKQHSSEQRIIKLVGMEDIHDICIIDVIKSIVEYYKKSFDKEIILTSIDDSELESIKKGYLNRNTIFWDDLHPARRLHELLSVKISEFIKGNYLIQNPLQFKDDSSFNVEKSKLPQSKYAEAPGSLSSEPSLLYPNTTFRT